MEEVYRGKVPAGRATPSDAPEQQAQAQEVGDARLDRHPLLPGIDGPADLKQLDATQLRHLCREIREFIIDVVSAKGGHLGGSLGVVELTVALHYLLDLPRDRLVWDTGHQAYVHKVLTGRREALWDIRQKGGISGFLKRDESPYDHFGAGHASTSISAALGMAAARDLAGDDNRVVAVIGDGAMTGGLAYEALNNAGQSGRKLLVILNDNGMSIAPNVGALPHYLTSITTSRHLHKIKAETKQLMKRLPALGDQVGELAKRIESAVKTVLVPGGLFEALGFNYIGPVDGHDLDQLLTVLPKLLERDGPVLLHVLTKKGKGLAPAESDDEGFHGVKPFDKVTGVAKQGGAGAPAYTKVFGDAMLEAAAAFPEMVAITAAMPTGTGLNAFKERHPERFFDVGIAEAHAVCFAAGLACEGVRPVAVIYSTFLQRAFDQVVHDVALQRLPVVFALDRGGLVGADGPTHHGVLDLSYLRSVPGMVVAAPKDGNELRDLLWTAMEYRDGPFAVRYPRDKVPAGFEPAREPRPVPLGSWERLEDGEDAAILAVGTMVPPAVEARRRLAARGVRAAVVNCRFVKPVDGSMLGELRQRFSCLVTVEESTRAGGFGDGVADALADRGLSRAGLVKMALPDAFVSHGPRDDLLEEVGLSAADIEATVMRVLRRDEPNA